MNRSDDELRQLERTMFRAWPSFEETDYDGWVLRFADGYTKRANSVNALYPSTLCLDLKISRCEVVYAARDLTIIFRMTPHSYPDGLDERLDQRGYKIIDRSLVMLGPLNAQAGDPVGYGLGVIDSELIGIFGLYVAPTARRSGLGKGMLRRIFQWAEMHGAGRAYLQVEANSDPALRLHQGMGLTEFYTYWYRVHGND